MKFVFLVSDGTSLHHQMCLVAMTSCELPCQSSWLFCCYHSYDEEQAMAEARAKLANSIATPGGYRSRSRNTDSGGATSKTTRAMSWK